MKLHKAAMRIVGLLAAIVRLDDQSIGIGSIIAGLADCLVKEIWDERT